MPELIVKFEDKVIERIVTEKGRIAIGRTSDNDVVLDNRGISRKHAEIELAGNTAVLIDNESLNGTFINDRRIEEEILKDNDVITIGKFNLIFRDQVSHETKLSDLDGTMVLKTKKQQERVQQDQADRHRVQKAGGGPVLEAVQNSLNDEYRIGPGVVTFGKAPWVNIRVKGWFVSELQAKITPTDGEYILTNTGRKSKTMVNGEPVIQHQLKNGDLIKVGKVVFRFIAGLRP
jgi:pSer/pThr/pTyr-binding forkhead associated (FHA) protein